MKLGYIKLYRTIREGRNRIYAPEHGLWAWRLLEARWERGPGTTHRGCIACTIQRGQFFTTLDEIAYETRINKRKVRTLIDRYIAQGSLKKRTIKAAGTLFTIVNYAKWQDYSGTTPTEDQPISGPESAQDPKLLPIGIKKEEVKKEEEVNTLAESQAIPEGDLAGGKAGGKVPARKSPKAPPSSEAKALPEWTLAVASALAANAKAHGVNPGSQQITRWREALLKIASSKKFSIDGRSPMGEAGTKDLLRWGLKHELPVRKSTDFPGWKQALRSAPNFEKVGKLLKDYHQSKKSSQSSLTDLSQYENLMPTTPATFEDEEG